MQTLREEEKVNTLSKFISTVLHLQDSWGVCVYELLHLKHKEKVGVVVHSRTESQEFLES